MKSKNGLLLMTLVSVLLGMMLAVQFKVTQSDDVASSGRVQNLTTSLKQAEDERERLKSENEELRRQIANTSRSRVLSGEMVKARGAAGLAALNGPGVTVTLTAGAKPVRPGEEPDFYSIQDEDLLKVVNELKASGAEAISINGQRIIAMSEIRNAGSHILVNTKKIAPPYVITGIGDPDLIDSSLRMKGGIIETTQVWGIQIKIKKFQSLKVPAYDGEIKYEFASPI